MGGGQSDRGETEILLSGAGQLLAWVYERELRGEEVTLGKARSELGSKVYAQAYKLALHGFIVIREDKRIELTEKGRAAGRCIVDCLLMQTHS